MAPGGFGFEVLARVLGASVSMQIPGGCGGMLISQ